MLFRYCSLIYSIFLLGIFPHFADATTQFVDLEIDIENARNYGYLVKMNHTGVIPQDGQDAEGDKFYVFPNKPHGDAESDSSGSSTTSISEISSAPDAISPNAETVTEKNENPVIKVMISNDPLKTAWNYGRNKKIMIVPVCINNASPAMNQPSTYSYVCQLHIDRSKLDGYVAEKKLTKCSQVTRGDGIANF